MHSSATCKSPNNSSRAHRRITGVFSLLFIAILAAAGIGCGGAQEGSDSITVSIGRIPQAQALTPITEVMNQENLIEKAGEDLGLDITVEWRDFPDGGAIRQALSSGNLDFGTVGNTPTLIGIAQEEPLRILSLAEGRVRFVIVMPPDSPIRTPEDLRGTRVGLLQGTDLQFFFDQMLDTIFGTSNYDELNIEVSALETLSQTASLPRGIEAGVATETSYLRGQAEGLNAGLLDSYGETEEHYDGPLGEGADIKIPAVEESPYYPEGFYLHRNFWLANDSMVQENPDAVVAFLIAEQQAIQRLQDMEPTEVADLAQEFWELDPEVGQQVWLNDLAHIRGWPWLTEGDLRAVVDQSELAAESGLIDSPLSWDQVEENISPVAPLAERAWEETGYPEQDEFDATDVEDIRGLPLWEHDQW
jgi:ABC-type nitrate/sulfonate/bicarbonate transport system substrate-binding protein